MTLRSPIELLQLLEDIRASYWFVPSVLTLGAILLAIGTIRLDVHLGSEWLNAWDFIEPNRPDGARALLSTIAGSMITVAGVTFSITIVAVSHASTQFGPRILTRFMRDRGNQITLGTFVATFVYCLMILRTIQGASLEEAARTSFVPHVSMLVAMGLTLASVGVFVFFLHHVPQSLHVGQLIAHLGRELESKVEQLCEEETELRQGEAWEANQGAPFVPGGYGYVERIDRDQLVEVAAEFEATIYLCREEGDFLSRQRPFARILPAEAFDEDMQGELEGVLVTGSRRSQGQSVIFYIDQLLEIATRALSPGINDPSTARNCMDWLGNVLILLAIRRGPVGVYRDAQGRARLIEPPLSFERVCEHIFSQIRPYAARDRNAAVHTFGVMRTVGQVLLERERRVASAREVLWEQARALREEIEPELRSRQDRELFDWRLRSIELLGRGVLPPAPPGGAGRARAQAD